MFEFGANPAHIDIGEGLNTAFNFLENSWKKWLPVAVVVAVSNLIVAALLVNIDGPLYSTDSLTGGLVWNVTGDELIRVAVGTAIPAILAMLAGWIYTGIVIAGIRNWPLTIGWLASRSLLSFVASFIVAIMVLFAAFAGIVVLSIAAAMFGALALVLWVAMLVGAVIVGIRFAFVGMAVFDGSGPVEGIIDSWDLTQGAALRTFGWALVAAVIVALFGIAGTVASLPFASPGGRPIAQFISSLASQIGICLTVFLMAVLYESQHARRYADADARGIVGHPRWPAPQPTSGPLLGPNGEPIAPPIEWPADPGSTSPEA